MTTSNLGRKLPPQAADHPNQRFPNDAAQPALRNDGEPGHGRAAEAPRNNLILPRSPLIGREHELAAIQLLLLQDQVGLITLTGPGGIGKTRLALQVAANSLDHFVDGVYFVSLAPIRDPDLVIAAMAQTLGVSEASGQPLLASLQAYLRDRQLLCRHAGGDGTLAERALAEASALARETGDPHTLSCALGVQSRHLLLRVATWRLRAQAAQKVVHLARATGMPWATAQAVLVLARVAVYAHKGMTLRFSPLYGEDTFTG